MLTITISCVSAVDTNNTQTVNTSSNVNTDLSTRNINETNSNKIALSDDSENTTSNTNKEKTSVNVEPTNGLLLNRTSIHAEVVDSDGNAVCEGQLIFKLNGKTLRSDGRFDTNSSALIFNVTNGSVDYSLYAYRYLKGEHTLTAKYLGTDNYETSEGTNEFIINRRTSQLNVSTVNMTRQHNTITFTVRVRDTSISFSALNNEKSFVFFKINGLTVKNSTGSMAKVEVVDGVARYNYTIPEASAAIDDNQNQYPYLLTAKYYSPDYEDVINNNTTYYIELSPTTINIKNITIGTNNISILANLTDYSNKLLSGQNIIVIKVNGVSINSTIVSNGIINLTIAKGNYKVNNVTIVTNQRYAYQKAETTETIVNNSKIISMYIQLYSPVSKTNVSQWVKAGITDVYVQARASTDNTSKLKEVISLTKDTNIRVHAWIICFITDNGFNISTTQQNMIKNFIRQVIHIDGVEGVCLDYARYSGTTRGVDTSVITNFVKDVKSILNSYNTSLTLSMSVFAEGSQTKLYYGQDYAALSPYVDVMLPMAYKYDYHGTDTWLKNAVQYVVNEAKYSNVIGAVQTYKESNSTVILLTSSALKSDVNVVLSAGSNGYCLFRYGLITSYP